MNIHVIKFWRLVSVETAIFRQKFCKQKIIVTLFYVSPNKIEYYEHFRALKRVTMHTINNKYHSQSSCAFSCLCYYFKISILIVFNYLKRKYFQLHCCTLQYFCDTLFLKHCIFSTLDEYICIFTCKYVCVNLLFILLCLY